MRVGIWSRFSIFNWIHSFILEIPMDKMQTKSNKGRKACSVTGKLPRRTRAIILKVNFVLCETEPQHR